MLKKREKGLLERAKYIERMAKVFKGFSDKGFGALGSVRALYKQKYPDLNEKDFAFFWNLKRMDDKMLLNCEIILEQLKSE